MDVSWVYIFYEAALPSWSLWPSAPLEICSMTALVKAGQWFFVCCFLKECRNVHSLGLNSYNTGKMSNLDIVDDLTI